MTTMTGAERQARYKARKLEADPTAFQKRRSEVKLAWAKRHPEKRRAHWAVDNALRSGRLVRPDECGRCFTSCKPEASHTDYSKPLDVEWLCSPCHRDKDRKKD